MAGRHTIAGPFETRRVRARVRSAGLDPDRQTLGVVPLAAYRFENAE